MVVYVMYSDNYKVERLVLSVPMDVYCYTFAIDYADSSEQGIMYKIPLPIDVYTQYCATVMI